MALLLIPLFLALMYVLVILPQQRRVRAHDAVVHALEPGQEVMTTAGSPIQYLDTPEFQRYVDADVKKIEENGTAGGKAATSFREQLEQHVTDPTCAGCHKKDLKHEPLGACSRCHSPNDGFLWVVDAGGINATALILVGVGPLLWILHAVFVDRGHLR